MILGTNCETGITKGIQYPEGWIVKPLQETIQCSFGGGTPSTTNPCFWNGPIPWITTAIINSEEIFLKCFQRGITQKALDSTSTQLAPKGSVLIGTRVGVGKIAVTTFDVAINQDITAFVLKENVDAEFLAYCMKQQAMQSWFEENKRGTTIKGVARNTILNLMIPIPPLPEQRAIARALRAVQGAREARLRELALEQERKAALMEHLFTHGTRGEATKMTEIGEMPESWRIISLGEIIIDGPQNGIYKPLELYGEGTPIIRINDFNNDGCFVNLEFKRVRLAPEEATKYKVSEKDIIINRVNSLSHLGKCALISKLTDSAVFESNMMRFHVDELKIDPQFLLKYLVTNENKDRIRNIAKRAVAQSSINQGDVKSLKVPFPSVSEQQEISEVLNACDACIYALDHEARLHDELFRAMLEELMNGRLAAGALAETEGQE